MIGEEAHPLVAVARGEERGHGRPRVHARLALLPLAPGQLRPAQRGAEALPELRLQGPDREPSAVAAAVHRIRRIDAGQLVTGLGAGQRPRHRHRGQGQRRAQQRDVHVLAAARALPRLQRSQDPDDGEQPGGHVDDLGPGHDRTAVRIAVGPEESSERAVPDVVTRPRGVRPVLPVPGDRAIHETRMRLEELAGTEPAPRQHARAEALYEDVRQPGQLAHHGRALFRAQVDGDGALAAIEAGVRRGLVAAGGKARMGSPSRGSIFTTSAPRSARVMVAYGPGM